MGVAIHAQMDTDVSDDLYCDGSGWLFGLRFCCRRSARVMFFVAAGMFLASAALTIFTVRGVFQ